MKDLAQERCLPIVGIQRVHDSFRGASGVQRGELRTRWWGWSWASCVGEGPGQLTGQEWMQPCRDKWNLGQDLVPRAASPPSYELEAKGCDSSGGRGHGWLGTWTLPICLLPEDQGSKSPAALEAWSLNHWTTRAIPSTLFTSTHSV